MTSPCVVGAAAIRKCPYDYVIVRLADAMMHVRRQGAWAEDCDSRALLYLIGAIVSTLHFPRKHSRKHSLIPSIS